MAFSSESPLSPPNVTAAKKSGTVADAASKNRHCGGQGGSQQAGTQPASKQYHATCMPSARPSEKGMNRRAI
jgi:putative hemolysin